MAVILHIETSGPTCSVCIAQNGIVEVEKKELSPNKHASILTILIQQLLAETGRTIRQLDAIAINKGPGSYTGLRIGAAVAKGICYTTDKPLIGLSSLQCLAWKMQNERYHHNNFFMPIIPARKDVLYYCVYNQLLMPVCEEAIIATTQIAERIKDFNYQPTVGFFSLTDDVVQKLKSFGTVIDYFECVSSNGCVLAAASFINQQFEDSFQFEPSYITGFGKNF